MFTRKCNFNIASISGLSFRYNNKQQRRRLQQQAVFLFVNKQCAHAPNNLVHWICDPRAMQDGKQEEEEGEDDEEEEEEGPLQFPERDSH